MEAQTWQRQFIIDLFDPIIQERLGYAAQIRASAMEENTNKGHVRTFRKSSSGFPLAYAY